MSFEHFAQVTQFVPGWSSRLAMAVLALQMICAATFDVTTRRIPTGLVLSLGCAFFVFALLTEMPWWLMGLNLATSLALLAVGFLLFSLGVFGGGDAKLLAAVGLWLGYPCVLPFLLICGLAGGVLAAAIGLWFMVNIEISARSNRVASILAPIAPSLPYGFAIAAAAILTLPLTWWMRVASA